MIRNCLTTEILKLRKSSMFLAAIITYLLLLLIVQALSYVAAKDMLMDASAAGNDQELLAVIRYSLHPGSSFCALLASYAAFAIPVAVTLGLSFLLSDSWDQKTIKVDAVYWDLKICLLVKLILAGALSLVLLAVSGLLNLLVSALLWRNLADTHAILSQAEAASLNPQTILLAAGSIFLVTLMYYAMAYLLTYGLGTNIPFIIILFANIVRDAWRLLPVTVYRVLLGSIYADTPVRPLLTQLLNTADYSRLLNGLPPPALIISGYLLASLVLSLAVSKCKKIY